MKKIYAFLMMSLGIISYQQVAAQATTLNESFTGTTLPTGWARQNLSSPAGAANWTIGTTTSDVGTAQGSGAVIVNYTSVAASSAGTISNWLFTPLLSLKDGAVLTFYTRSGQGATVYPDRMEVRVSTAGTSVNAGATATSVGDYTNLACSVNPSLSTATSTGGCGNPYPTTWVQYSVTLTGIGSTPVSGRIAFRYFVTDGGPNGANSSIIGVDEVTYDASGAAVCGTPGSVSITNVTTNNATVNWTAPSVGAASSYEVYYNTSSTAPTAATTPTVTGITTLNTTLTLPNNSTTYYVWVRTNCGLATSTWTNVASFTTLCPAVTTYPYTVPLSGITTTGTLPGCVQVLNVNNDNRTWTTALPGDFTTPPAGFSGPMLVYLYNSSNAANDWLFTRGLNLTAGTTYTLTFKYNNDGSLPADGANYYPEKLKVMYGDAATAGAMTNMLMDYPVVANATAQTATLTFSPNTSGTYYIGFQAYSDADMDVLLLNDITVSSSTTPVSLVNFSAVRNNANVNTLSWTTANEINNKGFEIERSLDGRDFSRVAFVGTKAENGNSANNITYSFVDEKATPSVTYYRLKQLDNDGKFAYSKVVTVNGAKVTKLEFTRIYPNPVSDKLNVVVVAPKADKVSFVVTDMAGKVVLQQAASVAEGNNNISLNIQQLNTGNYLVKAICAEGCETAVKKFVKQ